MAVSSFCCMLLLHRSDPATHQLPGSQNLDIAIAERRPEDALPLLKQAEKALLPGQKSGLYSYSWGAGPGILLMLARYCLKICRLCKLTSYCCHKLGATWTDLCLPCRASDFSSNYRASVTHCWREALVQGLWHLVVQT